MADEYRNNPLLLGSSLWNGLANQWDLGQKAGAAARKQGLEDWLFKREFDKLNKVKSDKLKAERKNTLGILNKAQSFNTLKPFQIGRSKPMSQRDIDLDYLSDGITTKKAFDKLLINDPESDRGDYYNISTDTDQPGGPSIYPRRGPVGVGLMPRHQISDKGPDWRKDNDEAPYKRQNFYQQDADESFVNFLNMDMKDPTEEQEEEMSIKFEKEMDKILDFDNTNIFTGTSDFDSFARGVSDQDDNTFTFDADSSFYKDGSLRDINYKINSGSNSTGSILNKQRIVNDSLTRAINPDGSTLITPANIKGMANKYTAKNGNQVATASKEQRFQYLNMNGPFKGYITQSNQETGKDLIAIAKRAESTTSTDYQKALTDITDQDYLAIADTFGIKSIPGDSLRQAMRAIIAQESSGGSNNLNVSYIAKKGQKPMMSVAIGATQITALSHPKLMKKYDLADPKQNIKAGLEVLLGLIKQTGSVEKALQAYGEGSNYQEAAKALNIGIISKK